MQQQRLNASGFLFNQSKKSMSKTLAEIFFDAIKADADLMQHIESRITSTAFEIPPGQDDDNTPVPNVIVIDDGFQNNASTKDYVWEGPEDVVLATIDVASTSDGDVALIVKKVRKAIERYICAMCEQGEAIPNLQPGYPQATPIQYDWMKPCYYQKLTYQCTISNTEDE